MSGDSIPDETTICRYRELLARLKLDKELFKRFNRQLEERGFILGEGMLVDATLKEAQAKQSSGRDKDASFTRRGGKVVYGYKGHVGLDADTNLIHILKGYYSVVILILVVIGFSLSFVHSFIIFGGRKKAKIQMIIGRNK